MSGDHSRARSADGSRPQRVAVTVVSVVVVAVALVAMVINAKDGNTTVDIQRDAHTTHDAALDNAFYHCIDVQVRSLVKPSQTVFLDTSLGDLVTLLKGVGSWVTVADPPSSADVQISLRDNVTGGGACLGSVVVARYPGPDHHVTVRTGTGDSVPGTGPPPAPPL